MFSSSPLHLVAGIVVVPGGAGGTVFGGVLVKKLKMTCSSIMKYEAFFTVAIIILGFMFFIVCEPVLFAGVNVDYEGVELSGKDV